MDAKQTVEDSLVMVQQMSGAPEEVLAVLDWAGQEKLVVELPLLSEQADEVQRTGVGLLALAEAIQRLVEGIPALAALFPTTQAGVRRSATEEDLDAMFSRERAQQQAAQIYNSVVELDKRIKQELQKFKQRSADDHGQTIPSN
jgi:hypothetical protein